MRDERRRNRRADCRRPPPSARLTVPAIRRWWEWSEAQPPRIRAWLEEQDGTGGRATPSPAVRSHPIKIADEVEQPVLQEPVRKRMEPTKSPGRGKAVAGSRMPKPRSRRLRQVEQACTDHADHRPVAANRPGLREDLGVSTSIRTSSLTRLRVRGSSSRTGDMARSRAISARWCRRRR